jgi:hypothetical protein
MASRRWPRVDGFASTAQRPARRFFQWLYEHGLDVAAI